MSWSLFEQRDQLAAIEKRRQEIAGQQAHAAQAPVAAPANQTGVTSLVAGPVAGMPSMALKASEPGIGKRRKRKGRDVSSEATPDTVAVAEGMRSELEPGASAKAFAERGADEGPGSFTEPGRLEPESVDRDYISDGHSAPSPQQEGPRTNPIQHAAAGIIQPLEMPSMPVLTGVGPLAQAAAQHQALNTLRPPIPGRETR